MLFGPAAMFFKNCSGRVVRVVVEGQYQIAMDRRKTWLEGYRFAKTVDRFLQVSKLAIRIAEMVVRFGCRRVEPHRLLKTGERFVHPANAREGEAQIVLHAGIARLALDRALVCRDGLCQQARLRIRVPEIK